MLKATIKNVDNDQENMKNLDDDQENSLLSQVFSISAWIV